MTAQPMFTPEGVWTLLHHARPLSAKPLPKRGDPVYWRVASLLNSMQQVHHHLSEDFPAEHTKRKKIAAAIVTLAELLPETRGDYEAISTPAFADDALPPGIAGLVCEGEAAGRRQTAAFERLLVAVLEAYEAGLPLVTMGALMPPLDDETVVIAKLENDLAPMLPSLGIGERHRFIAAVVAQITGNTSLDQKKVRQRLEYRAPH